MAAKIKIEAVVADLDGTAIISRLAPAAQPRVFVSWLMNMLGAFVSGAHRARLRVSVDNSVGVAASKTVTCVQASSTVGDRLIIEVPGGQCFTLTAATSPVAANGEYAIITSNTAVADSIRTAIKAMPGLGAFVVASGTSTLVLTAFTKGSEGNLLRIRHIATNTGAFTGTGLMTGGIDPGALQSLTYTITNVTTAADTLTIGAVVLTAAASAANENQYTIGGTAGASATNIANAINAHSILKGQVLATASGTSTGIITIQLLTGGRIGSLVTVAKSSAVGTLSAASFVASTTETYSATMVEYGLGGA